MTELYFILGPLAALSVGALAVLRCPQFEIARVVAILFFTATSATAQVLLLAETVCQ